MFRVLSYVGVWVLRSEVPIMATQVLRYLGALLRCSTLHYAMLHNDIK